MRYFLKINLNLPLRFHHIIPTILPKKSIMVHKVCVIVCPHCGFEKPVTEIEKRCVVTFHCKQCRQVSHAQENQECFEFRGIENQAVR